MLSKLRLLTIDHITLPFYEDFESGVVGSDLSSVADGVFAAQFLPSYPDCQIKYRNDYPARYGTKYIALECNYNGGNTIADANRARRADSIFGGVDAWTPVTGHPNRFRKNDGTEYWIGWSNYIPSDYRAEWWHHNYWQLTTAPDNDVIASGGYGGDASRSADTWRLRRWDGSSNPDAVLNWQEQSEFWADYKGSWVDHVIQVVFYDTDNANGVFRYWINGELLHEYLGKAMCTVAGHPVLSPCICYNTLYGQSYEPELFIDWNDIAHMRATYLDEFRIYEQVGGAGTNSYADVCPPIVSVTPTISSPSGTISDQTPTIVYSGYTKSRTDRQNVFSYLASQVQIDESGGDFSTPVYDSGLVSAETSHIVGSPLIDGSYIARVRHQSNRSGNSDNPLSDWSNSQAFVISGSGDSTVKLMGKSPVSVLGKVPASVMGKTFSLGPLPSLSVVVNTEQAAANLTTLGTIAWSHWGDVTASAWNVKIGTSEFTDMVLIGGATLFERSGSTPTTYTWTDGTPTGSATTNDGRFVRDASAPRGHGWQFTVKADTSQRILAIYPHVYTAGAQITVSLPGVADYNYSWSNLTGPTGRELLITYTGASASDVLTVKAVVTQANGAAAQVALGGAALY